MENFTVEELVTAIQEADSLDELKRMVGASEEETRSAECRIQSLDALLLQARKNGWGTDVRLWPEFERDKFNRLNKKQIAFENRYA